MALFPAERCLLMIGHHASSGMVDLPAMREALRLALEAAESAKDADEFGMLVTFKADTLHNELASDPTINHGTN